MVSLCLTITAPYSHWGEQVTYPDLSPDTLFSPPNLSECPWGEHETKPWPSIILSWDFRYSHWRENFSSLFFQFTKSMMQPWNIKQPLLNKNPFVLWTKEADFQREAESEPTEVKFWQRESLETVMPESSTTQPPHSCQPVLFSCHLCECEFCHSNGQCSHWCSRTKTCCEPPLHAKIFAGGRNCRDECGAFTLGEVTASLEDRQANLQW